MAKPTDPTSALATADDIPTFITSGPKRRANAMDQLGHITKWMLTSADDLRFSGEFWLAHLPANERADVLLSRMIDPKMQADKRRERTFEMAQEFYDYALQNIECHSLGQKYAVGAYEKGRGEPKVLGRYDFRLEPPPSNLISGISSQPASEVGVLAQSMHFSEISFGLTVQAMRSENQRLVTQLEFERTRNEMLQQKHMERITVMETMLSQNLERELLREAASKKLEREQKLWQTVERVAEVVLMQKGFQLPQNAGDGAMTNFKAALEQAKSFADSLTPSQIATISECLGEKQQHQFAGLILAMKVSGA